MKSRGLTLLELLIAVSLSAILLFALGKVFSSALRSNRVNEQATSLTQDAEVAAAILQNDVKNVGFVGGDTDSFGTTSPSATQIANFVSTFRWPFTLDDTIASAANLVGVVNVSGSTDPLPTLFKIEGTGTDSDTLSFLRVNRIDNSTGASAIGLQYNAYTVVGDNLTRLRQSLDCAGTFTPNSVCTLDGVNNGDQPVVAGVEAFHVFFQLKNANGGNAVYTSNLPNDVTNIASIGIYFRTRATLEDPNTNNSQTFPSNAVERPTGVLTDGTAISNWADLGVPTEPPYNDRFRRIEKILEISMPNRQPCNLLPIGWPQTSLGAVGVETTVTTSGGSMPGAGNFGWLSWNGSTSANYLREIVTNPILSNTGYIDPSISEVSDPDRYTLQQGSVVEGATGVNSSVGDALKAYENQIVLVPIWSNVEGVGSNLNYTINGFARIFLTSGASIASLTGTFLGTTDGACSA
ncbi:PilW family protein [Synechococcus sp. PCC 7336]|uniref:PilW family protein n=1 Tax=Synechococcus sp. PCC 7336 TaxID=195250 RepID=UPI00034D5D3E|nr:prepilin-type N-terminal cleavage/methylation domain-containing protein [Synechococcus sp. PCC 7336]